MNKDLALETLKSFVEHPNDITMKDAILALHPELAESKDERIRNLIYCLIRDRRDNRILLEHNGVSVDDALAYLGKQKEQESTEGDNESEIQKVFREGKSAGRKEVFDHPEEYGLQKEQNDVPSRETILGIWELGNLWKENPEEREGLTKLQYIQKYWFEKCDYLKEQKPLSTEETELNSIAFLEQMGYTCIPPGAEQKPEDNEGKFESIDNAFRRGRETGFREGVESVKQSAEWSEEDEDTYKRVYCLFRDALDEWYECVFAGCYPKITKKKILAMLKSIRPQHKLYMSVFQQAPLPV